jgi:hydrogenase maturation protease
MKREQIWEIANAVLYEGYLLYPYRHSALKNRQRWNFGVVYPRDYHEARGGVEPWIMRTECLVAAPANATLTVTVRFLHLLTRSSAQPTTTTAATPAANDWTPEEWQEGSEREVAAPRLSLGEIAAQPQHVEIAAPAAYISEQDATTGAVVTREQHALAGAFTVAAAPLDVAGESVYRLTIQIENSTPLLGQFPERHDAVLLRCFVSTHTILQVSGGAFVSLLDPPERLRAAAAACKNVGAYPVLVGDEGERDTMLASPIILYDYPQIAPESAGSLFDGTEIDEILSLRILALTDDEKEEMRQGDDRSRAILERTESLSAEQLMKLHGVMRSLGPSGAPAIAPADAPEGGRGI